ncbi:DEAD/DEAH box helicase [Crocinitomicaceae bacterium]|nr:DEAD/DEAH box helicase [Crocinitomicaceae bacterium]MDC0257608.1 DEAD/DEAH box helicase [Crocinitomicaceae bacterium]
MKIEQLLKNSGHSKLLPLQEATIEAFQQHNHVQLLAQTGSGKTLAFLLGAIQLVDGSKKGAQIVILSPTRELALQTADVFKSLKSSISFTTCYGGHPVKTERNELNQQPNVIIATPGRLLDHLEREHVNLSGCGIAVIDEFDKCLEFGFEKEMQSIREYLPKEIKSILVSATEIDYVPQSWKASKSNTLDFRSTEQSSRLQLWKVNSENTFKSLTDCLGQFQDEPSVVFCNYREVVEDVTERLTDEGITCIAYHGGMEQPEREMALIKFRNRSVHALICTDLGSRGLDIDGVSHVIHYQFPDSETAFIHRNGRTARADKDGNAYLLYKSSQDLPEYLSLPKKEFVPNPNVINKPSEWTTLYFGAGKKDKLRKLDIVGFLSQQGQLKSDEIGKIDLLDRMAYAAIRSNKLKSTLNNIHMKRIKGKRYVIKKAK